jgi:hypothetical protein
MFIFLVIRFGISWDPEIRAMLTTMRPGVDFSEYQHFSTISILLVSAFLWTSALPGPQHTPAMSTPRAPALTPLVLARYWHQHAFLDEKDLHLDA